MVSILGNLTVRASYMCLASIAASSAYGQDDSGTFSHAYFEEFAPSSAFDMIIRIPGFSIESDDDGSRGFGQAIGNVLIDRKRISGKSISAEDSLRRIPAKNVVRIEILDGTSLDIPGLTGQVANIVTQSSGTSGSFRWRSRFQEGISPYLYEGEFSLNGEIGNLGWSAGIEGRPVRTVQVGRENVIDGDNNLIETREEKFTTIQDGYNVLGGINWSPDSGLIANVNVEISKRTPARKELSFREPASIAGASLRRFETDENFSAHELSSDVEFDLGPGRLKLIGIDKLERSRRIDDTIVSLLDSGELRNLRKYTARSRLGETILRSEYSWNSGEGRNWEASLEGVLNTLERTDVLLGAGNSGPLSPIFDNSIPTDVEEKRYESFLTHTRQLNDLVSLQLSLGAEFSEIKATDPNSGFKSDSFSRPKGKIAVSWKTSDSLTVKSSLERQIGQLDFFDFVSTVDLDEGNLDAGNLDIVPQQAWVARLDFEKAFGEHGAGVFSLFAEDIEDFIDQVPFGSETEGPGNVNRANRFGVSYDVTLKLDAWGMNGAEAFLDGEWRYSNIDDPLTGASRPISNEREYRLSAELRHEIPQSKWYYGMGGIFSRNHESFRLNQVSQTIFDQPLWFSYLGYKDFIGHNAAIIVQDHVRREGSFERRVFSPRRTGDLSFTESRKRQGETRVILQVRGSF